MLLAIPYTHNDYIGTCFHFVECKMLVSCVSISQRLSAGQRLAIGCSRSILEWVRKVNSAAGSHDQSPYSSQIKSGRVDRAVEVPPDMLTQWKHHYRKSTCGSPKINTEIWNLCQMLGTYIINYAFLVYEVPFKAIPFNLILSSLPYLQNKYEELY